MPPAIPRRMPRSNDRENKTTRNLSPEIGAHDRYIVFGQTADQLGLKIIRRGSHRASVPLPVCGTALFDVFLQAIIEILVAAAFGHLGLVVELDLVHQKAREA